MRRENARLYREGRWTSDGRMLVDTRLPDTAVPLLSDRQDTPGGDPTIGCVIDVRRGRRGWVIGTLFTYADPWDLSGLACEADFSSLKDATRRSQGVVYAGGRLEAVTLGDRPCWKRMWLK